MLLGPGTNAHGRECFAPEHEQFESLAKIRDKMTSRRDLTIVFDGFSLAALTYMTKLKLDKEVGGGVLRMRWTCNLDLHTLYVVTYVIAYDDISYYIRHCMH